MAARETEQCSFPASGPVAVCPSKIKELDIGEGV